MNKKSSIHQQGTEQSNLCIDGAKEVIEAYRTLFRIFRGYCTDVKLVGVREKGME